MRVCVCVCVCVCVYTFSHDYNEDTRSIFSGVNWYRGRILILVAITILKSLVYPTIYP